MDKQALVDQIVAALESDLQGATQAALESAEEATDEESRAENKYDTRGLETSYLASAQAHYVKDLREQLEALKNLSATKASGPARLGSLVSTVSSEGREQFFISPARGGMEIEESGKTILVLTPKSPLGAMIIGKQVGGRTLGQTPKTIIAVD